jgi:hypothetical protein
MKRHLNVICPYAALSLTALLVMACSQNSKRIVPVASFAQEPPAKTAGNDATAWTAGKTDLHKAARTGDLALLQLRLRQGANPNICDDEGRTPLMDAVAAGQLKAMRLLLAAGAAVNARSHAGRTPLIEAAAQGQLDAARLLIEAGAKLNTSQRGWGTALETAERTGHNDIAELLLKAGARSSGKSVGDTVCVRPWNGDGYCGTVVEVNKTKYRIRVTQVVGCKDGCPAKAECSAGRPVGGSQGITVGDEVTTVNWCFTHTGVKP